MLHRKIDTSQGQVALLDGGGTGMPVVLIHGNSSSKEVFRRQFEGPLRAACRLIAFDLPGHGDSDNARDPKQAYTLPGYARVTAELLATLHIERAVLIGWSLGGHIGLEMLSQGYDAAGLMIIGTPPVPRGIFGMLRGFRSQLDLLLAAKARLNPREVERFAAVCLGPAADPLFRRMITRTDPRARPILGRSLMLGAGSDQRRIAEQSTVPLAVVNGSEEPFARLDYLAALHYGNLWEGHCHVIDGVGHAPFLEAPAAFDAIARRFIDDVAAGLAHRPDVAATIWQTA